MKKIILILIPIFLFLNNNILADGKTRVEFPIQIQITSGGVGAGPSIGYNINDWIYVGAESLSTERKSKPLANGAEGTWSRKTNLFVARISIWDDSGFYLQAGSGSADWSYKSSGPGTLGGGYWNGSYHDEDNSNKVNVDIKWPSSISMGGLGWNWIADNGFSGGFGIQNVSIGWPEKITVLDTEGEASAGMIGYTEKKYKNKFAQDYFSAHINIGWNF